MAASVFYHLFPHAANQAPCLHGHLAAAARAGCPVACGGIFAYPPAGLPQIRQDCAAEKKTINLTVWNQKQENL
ncbi:hypothetical protein DWY69_19170 [Eisenbergiella massiliensis]|uniref:Uncharacterized protein n=1 Tax=Eisenbergiella massiliensis TaxID=1720294 RepID=A0A3E3INU3_9FIRM|nr:hypothetical protein DWY69_19170 [Eisenbergiella massiliensis]